MTVVRVGAAVFILVVWSAVFVNAYVVSPAGPKPPAEFSAPMLAAATYLFGSEIRRQVKRNGNGGP